MVRISQHAPRIPTANVQPNALSAKAKRDLFVSSALSKRATAPDCKEVLTHHNDLSRTGAALCETTLTPGNVNNGTFGKVFTRDVDGPVFAQPLVVNNVTFADSSTRNAVIVATMNNTVYAFDAANPNASTPIWQTNLGPAFNGSDVGSDLATLNGILSTPVIDRTTNTLYAIAATRNSTTGSANHTLHAIDLTSGAHKLADPTVITASVPGNATDGTNGTVTFDSVQHLQRPALTLADGSIYVGFGSHGDQRPYHGWLMSYDAQTLKQQAVYISTPNSEGGAIWQSGEGFSIDSDGNVFGCTANGFDSNITTELPMSVVKWAAKNLTVLDSFTPSNWQLFDQGDIGIGSTGVLLPPNSNVAIAGTKQGTLYTLPRNALGGLTANDSTAQSVFTGTNAPIYGPQVFWDADVSPQMFVWTESGVLQSYSLSNDTLSFNAQGPKITSGNNQGGILSVSANGTGDESGIVWANFESDNGGVLYAFNASNVTQQLYSSEDNSTRDHLGSYAKFVPPTIANGLVFMANDDNSIVAYGLLNGSTGNGGGIGGGNGTSGGGNGTIGGNGTVSSTTSSSSSSSTSLSSTLPFNGTTSSAPFTNTTTTTSGSHGGGGGVVVTTTTSGSTSPSGSTTASSGSNGGGSASPTSSTTTNGGTTSGGVGGGGSASTVSSTSIVPSTSTSVISTSGTSGIASLSTNTGNPTSTQLSTSTGPGIPQFTGAGAMLNAPTQLALGCVVAALFFGRRH